MNELRDVTTTALKVLLVYQLLNRPTFSPFFATIMWQFHDEPQKYWMDCLNPPEGSKALVEALVGKAKSVHEAGIFNVTLYNSFRIIAPMLLTIPPPKGKGTKILNRMAAAQRRSRCVATQKRLIKRRSDMDTCYLYHLAWELELVAKHQEFQSEGKGGKSKLAK